MISYCFDKSVAFFWNKKRQVLVETESLDSYGNVVRDSEYVTKYDNGFSVMYELLDSDRKLVKYQVETVILSTFNNMINTQEKMAIMASESVGLSVKANIIDSKLKYAGYAGGM
jgi:hypothetical protein